MIKKLSNIHDIKKNIYIYIYYIYYLRIYIIILILFFVSQERKNKWKKLINKKMLRKKNKVKELNYQTTINVKCTSNQIIKIKRTKKSYHINKVICLALL